MIRVTKTSVSTLAAVLMAAVTVAPTTGVAQDWSGQVTLYGWGAGVTGDFTPFTGAPTLSFDKSLSEVLEDLDAAFFVTGLARRGDLVLFGDLTYSSSSRSGLTPLGPAAGEVTLRSLTLAAGRRFDAGGGSTLDVMGGLRAWQIDGSVSAPLAGISIAPQAEFVDPIIALRGNAPLSDRWSLLGYIDVGGFGAGSDLTWQASVTANYQATDNLYLSIGWRHLYVDYSDGGTVFEGAMTGPLIGVTWRF
ncbi:hypothetical protein [Roseicyclus mahoneyensis]|uniref:Outer membrane protein n=1 Tax=Roseicyclus mahoneyensis TaxID=164332 RepID=A0A316G4D1_9RHOB|nr:hypothetical protein [Roseicyclus mahoneyensis]PWK55543.1 hypothetical protein C7455_1177 [Roseicyclus mahoneyensis]